MASQYSLPTSQNFVPSSQMDVDFPLPLSLEISPPLPYIPGLEINNNWLGDKNQQIEYLKAKLYEAHKLLQDMAVAVRVADVVLPDHL
jgi:hypothetical protein